MHIHLAKLNRRSRISAGNTGRGRITCFDWLFTGRHVLAAHCVHLAEEEIDILVRHHVGIAHNPESNMKLASGIAPVPQLIQRGAIVGLGTDGAASNNNLDMLEDENVCPFT